MAKDEYTCALDYKEILDHYSNSYDETVYVDIIDVYGQTQTIVSNRVHPFYMEGEWKRADELESGDRLTGTDGSLLQVHSIQITQEPLKAYNLSVDDYHTYFVKAPDSTSQGVWVHNNCKFNLPDNWKQVSGKFDLENRPPNGVLFRMTNKGEVTSYTVYDEFGQAIKKVDLSGIDHRGVPTPHVTDYRRNTLPDGTVRVDYDSKAPPRPATEEEINVVIDNVN